MKIKPTIVVVILAALVLASSGCKSANNPASGAHPPQVTLPNGRSPATDNAPLAPMNDSPENRKGWNYGNGVLWVLLDADGRLTISEPAEKDSSSDFKGYSRVKFGWWRGVRGKFSIDGRRLDASAPPLRANADTSGYGDLGFYPSYLYFPTEGYWEVTGHIDNQSLTFVVHVIKKQARKQTLHENEKR